MDDVKSLSAQEVWDSSARDVEIIPLIDSNSTEFFKLINENRKHLEARLNWVPMVQDEADVSAMIRIWESEKEIESRYAFGVFYQKLLTGYVELKQVDLVNKHATLGLWIAKDVKRKGIGTSALYWAMKYGFDTLKLNRIEIRCALDNQTARNGIHRIGFTFEGVSRASEFLGNRFIDNEVYSILADEFKKFPDFSL